MSPSQFLDLEDFYLFIYLLTITGFQFKPIFIQSTNNIKFQISFWFTQGSVRGTYERLWQLIFFLCFNKCQVFQLFI